jgi:hypothetical protein
MGSPAAGTVVGAAAWGADVEPRKVDETGIVVVGALVVGVVVVVEVDDVVEDVVVVASVVVVGSVVVVVGFVVVVVVGAADVEVDDGAGDPPFRTVSTSAVSPPAT